MKIIYILLLTITLTMPILGHGETFDLGNEDCFNPLCEPDHISDYTGMTNVAPNIIVARIINASLMLLGTLALILVIYAGWLWMSAQGEEEQITKAKNILKGAFIGLIIIFASYAVSDYIFTNLANLTDATTN